MATPVTIISHPGGQYFTLTQGTISRYWLRTQGSRGSALMMTVTADFADGSSGAPVFNERGEVTGLVQATRPLGYQMVCRFATSVHEIRSLIQSSEKSRE